MIIKEHTVCDNGPLLEREAERLFKCFEDDPAFTCKLFPWEKAHFVRLIVSFLKENISKHTKKTTKKVRDGHGPHK